MHQEEGKEGVGGTGHNGGSFIFQFPIPQFPKRTSCLGKYICSAVLTMGFAKIFLFFFNFIYLGVSAAVITVAALLIRKYGDISKITTDPYTLVPCGILIGIGVLIFITALCGCCGTYHDSKCCLSFFFVLLLMVLALEVTAGVMGYVYKHKAENLVKKGFVDAIKKYDDQDTSLDKAVDEFQHNLKCCGSKDPSDWWKYGHYLPFTYPKSCCNNPVGDTCSRGVYKEGCWKKLAQELKDNQSYVLGIGIGLAVLQLLGMIGACYLMCCSQESGYLRVEGRTYV